MIAQTLSILILFLLKHKVTYASMCPMQRYTELDVYLQGFTLESSKSQTIFECYRKCEQNILCSTINMNLTDKPCELKYSTKNRHPEKTVSQQNTIYKETRDDIGPPESRPDRPIPSCKKLKEDDDQAKSGVYWMKFNEPSSDAPFQVFCDMTTDGGGWTLVYSYTFVDFSTFAHGPNAATPVPSWPVDRSVGVWEPESTATPISESSRSAIDFALWNKIGNEFLVKPNITNWIACVEGTGSLVNWLEGSLTCRVVKAITPTCTTVAPNTLQLSGCGPHLILNSVIYITFDGRTDACWPIHDPCGTHSFNTHLTNVPNPGGAVYIR